MSKNAWLALLVCVNVGLLAAVCFTAYALPAAAAEGTGLAANYLMVSGEIQDQYDALYLLDQHERTLHAFYWDKARRELLYTDSRDLDRDFRNNRGANP